MRDRRPVKTLVSRFLATGWHTCSNEVSGKGAYVHMGLDASSFFLYLHLATGLADGLRIDHRCHECMDACMGVQVDVPVRSPPPRHLRQPGGKGSKTRYHVRLQLGTQASDRESRPSEFIGVLGRLSSIMFVCFLAHHPLGR